jgi:hypothetical protein
MCTWQAQLLKDKEVTCREESSLEDLVEKKKRAGKEINDFIET